MTTCTGADIDESSYRTCGLSADRQALGERLHVRVPVSRSYPSQVMTPRTAKFHFGHDFEEAFEDPWVPSPIVDP